MVIKRLRSIRCLQEFRFNDLDKETCSLVASQSKYCNAKPRTIRLMQQMMCTRQTNNLDIRDGSRSFSGRIKSTCFRQ